MFIYEPDIPSLWLSLLSYLQGYLQRYNDKRVKPVQQVQQVKQGKPVKGKTSKGKTSKRENH